MNSNVTFSIIVPVYNCELYIEECIAGILAQTYQNYELIVVDDGSTDASVKLVQEMLAGKKNCQIVQNQHGGVCKARNSGLELSKGEYICFVDADDIIFKDYLEKMAVVAVKSHPDVIYFLTKYGVDKNERRTFAGKCVEELDKCGIEILSKATLYHIPELYESNSKLCGISSFSACGQVYRRELYVRNNIRFIEGITLSEDGLLNLEMLYYAKNAVIIKKELYNYRTDNISATRSYKPDMIDVFARRDCRVKDVITRLYSKEADTYMVMYYCSLLYELRMICEKCIFHSNNKKTHIERKKQFWSLIEQPDYVLALSRCRDCFLIPEDRKYLEYGQKRAVFRIIMSIRINQLEQKIRKMMRFWMQRLHLERILLKILGRS